MDYLLTSSGLPLTTIQQLNPTYKTNQGRNRKAQPIRRQGPIESWCLEIDDPIDKLQPPDRTFHEDVNNFGEQRETFQESWREIVSITPLNIRSLYIHEYRDRT